MNKGKQYFGQATRQTGVMLIEALVALLIFSVGILGLIGLQASATRASSDAKYRSEAALLANDLIGTMSTSTRASLVTDFDSAGGGARYTTWLNNNVTPILPGSLVNPPTVTVVRVVVPGPPAAPLPITKYQVAIAIRWAAPENPALVHQYLTNVEIDG